MEENIIFEFNAEKNIKLKEERDISFDEIIYYITQGHVLNIIENHNPKYKGQKFYVVDVDGYAYLVPFLRKGNDIFLKTIYPSRKATREYINEQKFTKGGNRHGSK